MEGFRHTCSFAVRFRDLDPLGHVNNSVVQSYVETGRVEYLVSMGARPADVGSSEVSFVLAHLSCDFRRPIYYGEPVLVGTRAVHLGKSSVKLEYRVEAEGALAAEGLTIVVHYDVRAGQSTPLPPDMREKIERFENMRFDS